MSPVLPATVALIVALSVVAVWWERARPSSRTLALVATLAAFAAAGRLVLAPVPGVQPTTDVVVLAGAALGPVPGFVVGAVAAVVSNLAFGQGPWTAWQMAGWGMCGLLGAAVGGRRPERSGRWRLAGACAAGGVLFGAVMNVSTWLQTTGAGRRELLAVFAAALPFDLAHIAGNVGFALAFGPPLLLAVRRARRRGAGRFAPATAPTGRGDAPPRAAP